MAGKKKDVLWSEKRDKKSGMVTKGGGVGDEGVLVNIDGMPTLPSHSKTFLRQAMPSRSLAFVWAPLS